MFYLLFYVRMRMQCWISFFLSFVLRHNTATVYLRRYSALSLSLYRSCVLPLSSAFFSSSPQFTIHISNVNATHRTASNSLCNVHIIFETVISLWFKAVKLRKYLNRNKGNQEQHKYWMCHTNNCLTASEWMSVKMCARVWEIVRA